MRKKYYLFILLGILIITLVGCKSNDSPEKVVEKYLKCSVWEERLDYVRNSETIKPLMEEHYKGVDFNPLRGRLKYEKYENGNIVQILTTVDGSNAIYFLIKENDEYKIDWEASMFKCDMSWAEFKATKPKKPQKFRVVAYLDDYYNYEFENSDKYWSISLSELTTDSITLTRSLLLNGYIAKDSQVGEELFELLKDGGEKAIILELQYPSNNDNSSNCVLITDLISDTIIEY